MYQGFSFDSRYTLTHRKVLLLSSPSDWLLKPKFFKYLICWAIDFFTQRFSSQGLSIEEGAIKVVF